MSIRQKNKSLNSRGICIVWLLAVLLHFAATVEAFDGVEAVTFTTQARDESSPITHTIRRVPAPGFSDRWMANDSSNLRSKSEVVREVKRRYDATVLKISLNRAKSVYRVRILLPSGKVRNITVNAKR